MSLKTNTKTTNYFSDDDIEEPNNMDISDDYSNDSDDYEMDEETRRIAFSSRNISRFISDQSEQSEQKEKKSNKQGAKAKSEAKSKKVFNLVEFNKKLEEEANAKKPKKFVSKRADNKKKQLGIDENIGPKRSFNPRKPPYNFVKSHDKPDDKPNIINSNDFPSL